MKNIAEMRLRMRSHLMVDSWGSGTNLEVLRDEEKDSTGVSTTSSELKGRTMLLDACIQQKIKRFT